MPPTPIHLFAIATGAAEPIYRQLVEQTRRLVAGGQLAAGEDMPSVRELAHTLAVNPMTVSKAYALLEADGVLERRRGLGMVVAAGPAQSGASRIALLKPTLEQAAREARQLELDPDTVLALFGQLLQSTTQKKKEAK
jgi:GntR family transcriptional regulator